MAFRASVIRIRSALDGLPRAVCDREDFVAETETSPLRSDVHRQPVNSFERTVACGRTVSLALAPALAAAALHFQRDIPILKDRCEGL
jgi:hypothetical protein